MNRLPQSTVHCKSLVVFWKVGLKIIFLLKSCSHTYPLFYFLWTLIRNNKVRFQISFLSIWRNWTEVCWKKVLILNKKRKWPVSQDIFSRHISLTNVDMIHYITLYVTSISGKCCIHCVSVSTVTPTTNLSPNCQSWRNRHKMNPIYILQSAILGLVTSLHTELCDHNKLTAALGKTSQINN